MLSELYRQIIERANIPYENIKPGKRIAVATESLDLVVMKVDRVGLGRANTDEEMKYVAVAKICGGREGVASIVLKSNGGVQLRDLKPVEHPGDLYGGVYDSDAELGVLSHRLWSGDWIELDKTTEIKPVTRAEMRRMQESLL